jgi:hypothetical protein
MLLAQSREGLEVGWDGHERDVRPHQVNAVGNLGGAVLLAHPRHRGLMAAEVRAEMMDDEPLAAQVRSQDTQGALVVHDVYDIRVAGQLDDVTPMAVATVRWPHDVSRIAEVVHLATHGPRFPVRRVAVKRLLEGIPDAGEIRAGTHDEEARHLSADASRWSGQV